ncbi:hypothetical protein A2982_04040 [candidate division WWE3 bacterium RIFCSPLOWO2_01_FULL_39_13]|uniref:Protease HtpX homolog n=1 Tax=candidate division WWE3 bacterium RIFCSPLOWO2_01_FULL_39_13 TaxID=1802624 RepID=A0A1F4V231_UNCKA|nr:MAG: hypothetical protein A2982_04040 [candidate division WWE3 bacterium RIFCSPLOWO2_01_FULL_39_13]
MYGQISSNKRKTVVVMAMFVAVVSLLGYFIGEIYAGQGAGVPVMISAVFFSSISAVSSYFLSDKIVLSISGAKKVGRDEAPKLYAILENLCIGVGIKKVPDLYIINDSATNAFATGRDPDHAVVAVTSGLIDKLDKREIEGVLGHELSHIKNYDMLLMTIVVVLVGSVTLIANIMLRGGFRGSRKSAGGIIILIGFLLAVLSPLIAKLIQLAVSRNREYLADASSALLTRDPEGLALALDKISQDREVLEIANQATEHLYIENPLRKNVNSGIFANLFNTHPPVEERIRRLRDM